MSYKVKEIYFTLQGEGAQAGRPAVFCRFAGCNLWSGREEDRSSAKCWFCDTDFVGTDGPGGGSFDGPEDLADAIDAGWPAATAAPLVVFTGGEPFLQLDEPLIKSMHDRGFVVAVETNGTLAAPSGIDWITVSPKPKTDLIQKSGTELKLVYPGIRDPEEFEDLNFEHFFLSPLWTSDEQKLKSNIAAASQYCQSNPKWRLTMQYHKIWGIP